jgi:hypothetical protein
MGYVVAGTESVLWDYLGVFNGLAILLILFSLIMWKLLSVWGPFKKCRVCKRWLKIFSRGAYCNECGEGVRKVFIEHFVR